MRWIKKINAEIILALAIGFFAVIINAVHYHNAASLAQALHWIVNYFSFGNPFFVWFFFFIYLVFLQQFYVKLVGVVSEYIFNHQTPSASDARQLCYYLVKPLYVLFPLAIVTGPMFTLLSSISYELRFSGLDKKFLDADFLIFGHYFFIELPSYWQSRAITFVLKDSYMSLALIMSALLGFLYLWKEQVLFRQAILAFLASLALTYPLFYLFPCQDPSHYVIQGLRHYPVSKEVKEAFKMYKPSVLAAQIVKTIDDAETDASRDNTVPISCFPSMHAVWAYFIIYFLARVSVWSLLFTVPWTFLVLTGGLYFAQHYAVDYLIAIPVALASIFVANFLLRLEKKWKRTSNVSP